MDYGYFKKDLDVCNFLSNDSNKNERKKTTKHREKNVLGESDPQVDNKVFFILFLEFLFCKFDSVSRQPKLVLIPIFNSAWKIK